MYSQKKSSFNAKLRKQIILAYLLLYSHPKLLEFCNNDKGLLHDCVQDTILELYDLLYNKKKTPNNIPGWAYTICRRTIWKNYDRSRKAPTILSTSEETTQAMLDKIEAQTDVVYKIDSFVRELEMLCRITEVSRKELDLLLKKYSYSHTFEELAEVYGISASTLRKKLSRLKKRMKANKKRSF